VDAGDVAMDEGVGAADGDAAVDDEDGGDIEELEVTESSTSF
jgi:hypothetical protein